MSAERKQEITIGRTLHCALLYVALITLSVQTQAFAQEKAVAPAQPKVRAIPGVTAEDRFPGGCVDCHVKMPEMDVRISTLMKQWSEKVPAPLLAKAEAAAPTGAKLQGKHPLVPQSLGDIPAGCLKCHGKNATKAPPFARLLHAIHLTGGEQNHFLTLFQGECTYCHKLDVATGAW